VFSPDGRVLASGGDRDVKLWEVATGQPLGARRADGRAVLALAFLPQPGRLASAGTDGDVLVWDVSRELREAAPVPKDLGRGVTAPAETGYWSRRFPLEGRASGVAFAPDGKTLAVGSQSGRIHLFDFATGKPTGTLDGHTSEVVAIVYAPDGKTIVSTAHLWDGKDLPVRAWDAPTGKPLWARADTRTFPTDLALPADGRTVYTTGNGGIPRWDMKTGEPLPRVKAYDQYTTAMAVSADGKYLMAGGFRDVVLWDLVRDRRVRTWRATEDDHNNTVEALAFSPDGATAVTTATDGRVRAWDVGTGERRAERATGGRVMAAAFSPEGDLLALAGEPSAAGFRVRVWDTRTWAERLRLIAHGPRVAWSPDGRWLATADVRPFEKEHYVLVWDVKALLGR
jgi:WD40 repeat protein